jgi:hypothetical protein
MSDDEVRSYKTHGKYSKTCLKCNSITLYKTRETLLQSINENKICKKCASREKQQKLQEAWIPITGTASFTLKMLKAIRVSWRGLSDEDKKIVLNKTDIEKQVYWNDLKRRNKIAGYRKWRQIISERYAGENHWMKRPDVISKIKETCKKYTGDNHWFRKNKIKPEA